MKMETPKPVHELIDEHWEREANFARIALAKATHQLTPQKRAYRNPNQLRLNVNPDGGDVIRMEAA